jgi:hypothetical protein
MNIGALIPQVFYDLIGRIVPGLIIIASSYIVYRGNEISIKDFDNLMLWFSGKDTSSLFLILTFLMMSYFMSLMIDGVHELYASLFNANESYCKLPEKKLSKEESNKIL